MKRCFVLCLAAVMVLSLWISASAETNEALLSYYGGDVNGDWSVTTSDVRVIYAALSGQQATVLSKTADANDDGTVNMLDALVALRSAAGLEKAVLVSPSAAYVTALPEGEGIAFTESACQPLEMDRGAMPYTRVRVVQSYEELSALYAEDAVFGATYGAVYDRTYFESGALVLVRILMSEYPNGVALSDIVRSGELLTVQMKRIFPAGGGSQPAFYHACLVAEISKEALQGVNGLQIDFKDVDTTGADRVR